MNMLAIKKYLSSQKIHLIYLIVLTALSGFFLFWNLDQRSLQNWDEGIYAIISHELAQKPSLTLRLHGELWLEKPPLGFFVEAMSISLLGFSEWAIRLPSSIYTFISIIFIYLLGKELFNKHLGFLAALLTLISPALLHDHMTRSGDLDSGLLLFTVLAFYLLIKSLQNKKYFVWSAVAAGLGIMVRGSSGIFIILISAIVLLLTNQFKKFTFKDYFSYLIGLLIIAVPWHLQQLIVHGSQFWDIYILEHFLSRIVVPIQNHAGTWDYYFTFFYSRHGYLVYLIWISFAYAIWKIIAHRQKNLLLPVIWLIVTLAPMIVMQTKLWWYAITLIPAMMILLAYFIFDQYKNKKYILASLITIFLLIFNLSYLRSDYIFVTQQKSDSIEQIANALRQLETSGVNLVVYNTQYWINGKILPQAQYYLQEINNNRLFLIGEANLEYYIDNVQYQYFLTNLTGLEVMNVKANNNYSFTQVSKAGDLILVKKTASVAR